MDDTRNLRDEYKGLTNEQVFDALEQKRCTLEVAIENVEHDFNAGTIVRSANNFNVSRVHIIGRRKYNRRGAMCTDKYLTVVYWASVEEFLADQRARGQEIVAIENNVAEEVWRRRVERGLETVGQEHVERGLERVRSGGAEGGGLEGSDDLGLDAGSEVGCRASGVMNGGFTGVRGLVNKKFVQRTTLVFGSEGQGISAELLEAVDDIREIESLGSTRSVNVGVAAGIAMYEWARQCAIRGGTERMDATVHKEGKNERMDAAARERRRE